MTPDQAQGRRSGAVRALLAVTAAALVSSVALTAASYTDHAAANFGNGTTNSGIGNPNRFDIAVRDSMGVLQDASTPASAVLLPLTSGTAFTETTPVVFEATFANRAPGIAGDLVFSIYDPDDTGATDLFRSLRYTLYLAGSSTPVVANATADALNLAAATSSDVAPGGSVLVRLEAVIAPGAGMSVAGQSTQLGMTAQGESR